MVSSNILSLDEVSDDSNTTRPAPINAVTNPQLDDHNNPIIMNEQPPTAVNTTETISNDSPFDANTTTAFYPIDDNNSSFLPQSTTGDDSDASDATCENDDLTAIETKCEDEALLAEAPMAKPLLRPDDILISHSTPVVVAGMATVPTRPLKSIRPTGKACMNAAKNVHFTEEAKPTVRVLLLCQPTSHQFQVCL